jgi:hypothetical protein
MVFTQYSPQLLQGLPALASPQRQVPSLMALILGFDAGGGRDELAAKQRQSGYDLTHSSPLSDWWNVQIDVRGVARDEATYSGSVPPAADLNRFLNTNT